MTFLCLICNKRLDYGIIDHIEKQHSKYAEVKDYMELSKKRNY